MADNIYLIGFMGAGKTTVGRYLANQLGVYFVDLDQTIEAQADQSIAEIFAEKGEPFFRELEAQTLCQIQEKAPVVVATGGGIVLNEKNRAFLKKQKYVFFLDKNQSVLLQHLAEDQQAIRPLILEKKPSDILSLYQSRRPLYLDCATVVIKVDQESPAEIGNQLHRYLLRKGEGQ